MTIRTSQLLLAAALSLAGAAHAADVTVFVDGRSGPWDIGANPAFGYGEYVGSTFDSHLPPTSVSNASGLAFAVGDSLTIQYVSGNPLAGASGTAWGGGADGVLWWAPTVPPCTGSPGCYTGATTYLEQLLGVYANSGGGIVGTPFIIGNGPTSRVIPIGASQLLLGFNDGWYNDNGSGIYMKVTEVAAVPEPETYAMMMAGLGLLGFVGRRKKRQEPI